MRIYFFSGLGTDEWIFDNLKACGLECTVIPWEQPTKDESYSVYLMRHARHIDRSEPFVLGGVSFGGMAAQSLAPELRPAKLILISTARKPAHFAWPIRVFRKLPLRFLISGWLLKATARILIPIRTKANNSKGEPIRGLIDKADPLLLRKQAIWALNWQPASWHGETLVLLGSRDILFPSALQKDATILQGGDHGLIAARAKEIAEHIRSLMNEDGNR